MPNIPQKDWPLVYLTSGLRLAMYTGIAPGDISRIENEWLRPYPGWRKRLARALGTTEQELFPNEQKGQSDGT